MNYSEKKDSVKGCHSAERVCTEPDLITAEGPGEYKQFPMSAGEFGNDFTPYFNKSLFAAIAQGIN